MRLITRVAAIGCALTLSATLAGCGGSGTSSAVPESQRTFPPGSTMDRIQQRGKVIIGVKYDQPSFGMLSPLTGEPEGFDIEIAKLVAEDLTGSKDNIEYVEAITANREQFIQQGKVDMVIATYVVNEKRKKKVSFAGPYYDTGVAIMTRKGDRSIRNAQDMNGRPVCVAQGSHSAELVPHIAPRVRLSELSTYSYCAQALKDKRVDATVTSESILIGLAQQNPELTVQPGLVEPEQAAIGFAKGDKGLHRYLTGLLKQIVKDGRWEKAYWGTVGKVTDDPPKRPRITL